MRRSLCFSTFGASRSSSCFFPLYLTGSLRCSTYQISTLVVNRGFVHGPAPRTVPRECYATWQRVAKAFVKIPIVQPHLCKLILTNPFAKPHLCRNMAKVMAKVVVLSPLPTPSQQIPHRKNWLLTPAKKILEIASVSVKVLARISGHLMRCFGHSKTCVFRRRKCETYNFDTTSYLGYIWTYVYLKHLCYQFWCGFLTGVDKVFFLACMGLYPLCYKRIKYNHADIWKGDVCIYKMTQTEVVILKMFGVLFWF